MAEKRSGIVQVGGSKDQGGRFRLQLALPAQVGGTGPGRQTPGVKIERLAQPFVARHEGALGRLRIGPHRVIGKKGRQGRGQLGSRIGLPFRREKKARVICITDDAVTQGIATVMEKYPPLPAFGETPLRRALLQLGKIGFFRRPGLRPAMQQAQNQQGAGKRPGDGVEAPPQFRATRGAKRGSARISRSSAASMSAARV